MAVMISNTTHTFRKLDLDEFTNRWGEKFRPSTFEVCLDEDADGRQVLSATLHGTAILKNGQLGKAKRHQHWYAVSGRVPQVRDIDGHPAMPPLLIELVNLARSSSCPHDDLLNDAATLWGEQ